MYRFALEYREQIFKQLREAPVALLHHYPRASRLRSTTGSENVGLEFSFWACVNIPNTNICFSEDKSTLNRLWWKCRTSGPHTGSSCCAWHRAGTTGSPKHAATPRWLSDVVNTSWSFGEFWIGSRGREMTSCFLFLLQVCSDEQAGPGCVWDSGLQRFQRLCAQTRPPFHQRAAARSWHHAGVMLSRLGLPHQKLDIWSLWSEEVATARSFLQDNGCWVSGVTLHKNTDWWIEMS